MYNDPTTTFGTHGGGMEELEQRCVSLTGIRGAVGTLRSVRSKESRTASCVQEDEQLCCLGRLQSSHAVGDDTSSVR